MPVMTGLDVDFTMVDGRCAVVPCTITRAAIEKLAKVGAPQPPDPFQVFLDWQDEIERVASAKFDAGKLDDGRVMVGPADLASAGVP